MRLRITKAIIPTTVLILAYTSFRSFVRVLLLTCRPAAVGRLIIAIVVWVAVYRVLRRWSAAHIFKKILELQPAFADSNPTSAVVFEVEKMWIRAPRTHILPCLILSRSTAIRRVSMLQKDPLSSDAKLVFLQASTALCRTTDKPVSDDVDQIAALTPTFPLYKSVRPCVGRFSIRTSGEHCKSAELFPCKVVECRESFIATVEAAIVGHRSATLGGELAPAL